MIGSTLGGASDLLAAGFDYSTTLPTPITAGGSNDTVGAYVELLSAANNDRPITRIIVHCRPSGSSAQGDIMLNIAIGGAGSEIDTFKNLWLPSTTTSTEAVYYFDFMVSIPSGVRISANCQANVASRATTVSLQLSRGGLASESLNVVDTIGANTGATEGITVNTAGTINTFGAWTELIASTAQNYQDFIVAAHKIGGSMTGMNQTYDIGIGTAGNEEIIYSGQSLKPTTGEEVHGTISPRTGVLIPKGVRVSARVQSTSTDADGNLDFILYGVY